MERDRERYRVKLSGWVREQNRLGDIPKISSERLDFVERMPPPRVVERVDRLLLALVDGESTLGETCDINDIKLIAETYSVNKKEVALLCQYLKEAGLVRYRTLNDSSLQVTLSGYRRYEELGATQSASAQGFVAMWFHDSMKETYDLGFEVGVAAAGYSPLRVDRVEHADRIDDEIIRQIRRSRFVVADFTGHRGGVYFEAGYAMGLGLPVIWACRKDQIPELHFDIRQFNCIDWSAADELAARLHRRIEAVVGAGPRPVAT
ncbi:hypothetical protein [Tistlia consotensis]|uniref:hypothetical protein n=1 Tax=Tistlia consotensis TaxID=1321365 RepID=UPI00117E9901|nr:hypothetical protein [Tistlia consotensis]